MMISIKRSGASMLLRCGQFFLEISETPKLSEIQEIPSFRLRGAPPYYFVPKVNAYSVLKILGKIVILLQKLDSVKYKGNKLP